MEGDGAYRALKEREREKQTSELLWFGMCVLVQMCVRLGEYVLILMEQLGVSNPAHICVRVEGIS